MCLASVPPDGGGAAMEADGSCCGDQLGSEKSDGQFSHLQAAKRGKMTMPLYPLEDADVLEVALARGIQCAAALRKYKAEFMETMGKTQSMCHDVGELCRHGQEAPCDSGSEWRASSVSNNYDYESCKAKQDVLFD